MRVIKMMYSIRKSLKVIYKNANASHTRQKRTMASLFGFASGIGQNADVAIDLHGTLTPTEFGR